MTGCDDYSYVNSTSQIQNGTGSLLEEIGATLQEHVCACDLSIRGDAVGQVSLHNNISTFQARYSMLRRVYRAVEVEQSRFFFDTVPIIAHTT
jgi:hypothetical protein